MLGNKASKITNLITKTLHKLPPQAFPPPLSWFHTQQGINDKVYPHLKQPPLNTCSSDVPIWSCVWSSKTVPVCVDSKYFLSHSFQLCSNYPCRYHTTMYNHSLNHISLEKDRPRFLQSPTAQDINTRSHQLYWGDQEMGTAISCTQWASLILAVGRSSLKIYSVSGLQTHNYSVADLGGVRGVQMHPPLTASNVFLRT